MNPRGHLQGFSKNSQESSKLCTQLPHFRNSICVGGTLQIFPPATFQIWPLHIWQRRSLNFPRGLCSRTSPPATFQDSPWRGPRRRAATTYFTVDQSDRLTAYTRGPIPGDPEADIIFNFVAAGLFTTVSARLMLANISSTHISAPAHPWTLSPGPHDPSTLMYAPLMRMTRCSS